MDGTPPFPYSSRLPSFATALLKASLLHCDDTGEDHLAGDVESILAILVEEMEGAKYGEFARSEALRAILGCRGRTLVSDAIGTASKAKAGGDLPYLVGDEIAASCPRSLIAPVLSAALEAAGDRGSKRLWQAIVDADFGVGVSYFDSEK